MTTLSVQLQTALDELDMAHNTLTVALDDARLSAQHSGFTPSLKRILAENQATMLYVTSLLKTIALLPPPPPL